KKSSAPAISCGSIRPGGRSSCCDAACDILRSRGHTPLPFRSKRVRSLFLLEPLMRTEVHVHGSIFLCKGVRPSQVDQALRPWLDYLDVDTIGDAHSLEREEPGMTFDPKERVVNICW